MTSQTEQITEFFADGVPKEWFGGQLSIECDDIEILCVGQIPTGTSIGEFREATRGRRIELAEAAESRFGRKVSWGVTLDGVTTPFTTLSIPTMTRLRLRERAVLDTLIDAGVARSTSDALAWCVKLVARHQSEWLAELREALVGVEKVRAEGPTAL
jgi:hypothetical protein